MYPAPNMQQGGSLQPSQATADNGAGVQAAEVVTKMALYYFHERGWCSIR